MARRILLWGFRPGIGAAVMAAAAITFAIQALPAVHALIEMAARLLA